MGNRTWGAGEAKHWIGSLVMTIGVFLHGFPVWSIPGIAGGVFLWRVSSPRPWRNLMNGNDWAPAIKRGLLALPLSIELFLLDMQWWHLILGAAAVLLVPAAYWISGRIYKPQCGELAELLSGAVVGTI